MKEGTPLGDRFFAPGHLFSTPLEALSLHLTLFLGTAGLPHILIRFFTVKDAVAVRQFGDYGQLDHRPLLCDDPGPRIGNCGAGGVVEISGDRPHGESGGALVGRGIGRRFPDGFYRSHRLCHHCGSGHRTRYFRNHFPLPRCL